MRKVGSYHEKSRELPREKSGVTARKVGSYREKSRELPQAHVRSYHKEKLGVSVSWFELQKKSGVTASKSLELPGEKSGVTVRKVGVTARKSWELPLENSVVIASFSERFLNKKNF